MAKNILVPIDFSTPSLNTLKIALEENKNEELNLWLIYAHNLSSSITELLFYSQKKIIQSLMNSDFEDAFNILKNTFESSIKSIHIELFHGSNANAFTNYALAKKIDLVYFPKNYTLKLGKNGFNPILLIKKSSVSYKAVSWPSDNNDNDNNSINQLFI
jgi:hypothetical protein